MKLFVLLGTILFLTGLPSFSQNCGTCMIPPRVVFYDLEIQTAKPASENETAAWQLLNSIGKITREQLSATTADCIRFIHPLSISTSQGSASVPATEVCDKADYLIVGHIRSSGDGYMLHLELQASCSRTVLTSSDLPFRSSLDSIYVMDISKQPAARFGSLRETINKYAISRRNEDKNTALGSAGRNSIIIEPKKYDLSEGEETEVTITVKDCDGTPLAGRTIDFSGGTIDGIPIEGTTGGTVSPAQVVTDGSGKAKVKFKMGKDKSAVLRPHTVYKKPSGGKGVLRTAHRIPKQLQVVEVTIFYFKSEITTLDPSSFMASLLKGKEQRTVVNQDYFVELDHVPADPASGFLILSAPEEGQERTLHIDESGDYSYVEENPEVLLDTRGGAIEIEKQLNKSAVIKEERKISPSRHASIVFFTGNENEPMRFQMALNFENETDLAEGNTVRSAASLTINENTPGAKFSMIKNKDPKSIYKEEYRIMYLNKDLGSMDEANKYLNNPIKRLDGGMHYTGTEALAVFIRVFR